MKLTVYEDGRVCPKEAPVPSFLEDEVLFRVKACGICGSDLPRVFSGKAYYYPIVLGHEFLARGWPVLRFSDPSVRQVRVLPPGTVCQLRSL